MLKSEKAVLKQLLSSYDKLGAGNIQVLHMMMDMQLAYPVPKPPRYPFPNSCGRWSSSSRTTRNRCSAFPPSIPGATIGGNWPTPRSRTASWASFYPALGYLPIGNADPVLESRVAAFFDYCIAGDIPVFVHCTPIGFQTKERKA